MIVVRTISPYFHQYIVTYLYYVIYDKETEDKLLFIGSFFH